MVNFDPRGGLEPKLKFIYSTSLPLHPIPAILIDRTVALPNQSSSLEMTLTRRINARLTLQYTVDSNEDGCGGGGGGRGGGRGGGGGNDGNGAAGTSKTREKGEPAKKRPRTEKRVTPNEDLGLGFFIEERVNRPSDQSREQFRIWSQPSLMFSIVVSSCERPHYGVDPKEWDIATTFSTLADDKPRQEKVYSGHSTLINRESDCGEGWPFFVMVTHQSDKDDRRKWRFGPSSSSNMIIVTARRLMNI